jgi:MFS family permease
MNKPTLWTRDFVIITLTNFFVVLNFYVLLVIISVFAMDSFHSSPSEAGLATGIFVIGALVARLFSGKWIERIGRKRMLYAGLISGLAMTLLYFWINGILFLFIVRFLHGATFGIMSTAAATIVSHTVPRERCGEGLGYYALSVTLATAVGPFLAIFFSRHGGYNVIFIICTISAVLSLAIGLFSTVSEIELTKEQSEAMKGFRFNSFFEPKAIPISIVCGAVYFCYSSVVSFLAPYTREINLADAAPLFFVVYAVAIFFSRPYTGRLFDTKGENFAIYPAILMFMIGMLVLSHAGYGYSLLSAGALIGLGVGVIQFSGQAISVKASLPHRLGLANSTFFMFVDVSVGIGPFILGLFVPYTGYRMLYRGVAIAASACVILYYILHGKRAVSRKVETIN